MSTLRYGQIGEIRLRAIVLALGAVIALPGCVQPRRAPPPTVNVPVPIAPFDNTPNIFSIQAPRFSPGEVATVRVCVDADHVVVSAELIGSSGDQRFDGFALMWARQVRLRYAAPAGTVLQRCGPVRVEIRKAQEPKVISGADVSLG